MSLIVLGACPNCKKLLEAHGDWLQACELKTKECWVIECESCGHVFVQNVSLKEESPTNDQPSEEAVVRTTATKDSQNLTDCRKCKSVVIGDIVCKKGQFQGSFEENVDEFHCNGFEPKEVD
jgi:ribosomal protein L32